MQKCDVKNYLRTEGEDHSSISPDNKDTWPWNMYNATGKAPKLNRRKKLKTQLQRYLKAWGGGGGGIRL